MTFKDVSLKLLRLLHQKLAVLFAHVDWPGVLKLLVLRTLEKLLDFHVVIQAFHAIVPELSLRNGRVWLRVQEVLFASLIERLRVDVHSLEEVLLLLLGERLQNLLDHDDCFVLFLGGFSSEADLRSIRVHLLRPNRKII